MRTAYLLLALLALSAPAYAAMISGTMAFDIFVTGIEDPVAQGFVDLQRNQIRDFQLTFNGHAWDVSDVDPCRCEAFPHVLTLVALTGGDAFGSFLLFFDLHPEHDNFGMALSGGGLEYSGNLHSGTAGAELTDFTLFIDLPEPGTPALLSLGLLGLALTVRSVQQNDAQREA